MVVAHESPLSMRLTRQEYWSGLSFPSLKDIPKPGIKPVSPALQVDSLPSALPRKPTLAHYRKLIFREAPFVR